MKGKRLPELVDGELDRVLAELSGLSYHTLLVRTKTGMPESAWADVFTDFDIARAHMVSVLQIKLDFARRLPWSLAALAHSNSEVASSSMSSTWRRGR